MLMLSWHGNSLCITGSLWWESTSQQHIPLTKGKWCRAMMFPAILDQLLNKKMSCQWFEIAWDTDDVTIMSLFLSATDSAAPHHLLPYSPLPTCPWALNTLMICWCPQQVIKSPWIYGPVIRGAWHVYAPCINKMARWCHLTNNIATNRDCLKICCCSFFCHHRHYILFEVWKSYQSKEMICQLSHWNILLLETLSAQFILLDLGWWTNFWNNNNLEIKIWPSGKWNRVYIE